MSRVQTPLPRGRLRGRRARRPGPLPYSAHYGVRSLVGGWGALPAPRICLPLVRYRCLALQRAQRPPLLGQPFPRKTKTAEFPDQQRGRVLE